jgi:2-polyprenyl-3-methyl-5-hydroxy-6-metoxy-1,4-benzoquinol methylase
VILRHDYLRAWANADFEDCSIGHGNELLPNLVDGFRVTEHGYDVRINPVSVEGHGYLRRRLQTDKQISRPLPSRWLMIGKSRSRQRASPAMNVETHWEQVYREKAPDTVSWYRPHLETSLALIEKPAPERGASIVDVGGGESTLVDDLLAGGYQNLTVLDVSQIAIDVTKEAVGLVSDRVQWITADIGNVGFAPNAYDVWHDRAVFHFLTATEQRVAYVRQVARSVKPGGHVLVSTFGPEGPTKCSGLEVVRYDAESLHVEFGVRFRMLESLKELHNTSFGSTQQFLYCLCRIEGTVLSGLPTYG